MTDSDWSEVEDLFGDLLDLPQPDREGVLLDRTRGRPGLKEAVASLLRAHQDASSHFLSELDPGFVRGVLAEAEGEATMAGPYRLVREVGRGGMGSVYEAERADGQFDQRVAVKMLKRGMDSDAIFERFLRERQILAGFDHPSIARLIDGGIADDGRPFIVMEYVEGFPLTAYCDQHKLSLDQRLELFKEVCDAVAHAHRSLVVHRDLKPSNILVSGGGAPKLLDFGIAKLLQRPEGSTADTTDHQVRLLTPEYAAPEQVLGLPVTTATDVYGLGAVLFELLSGQRPPVVGPAPGASGGLSLELLEAPLMAQSLDGLDRDRLNSIGAARATDAARLRRRLSGDIGAIVSTALSPEPERRYASVDALRDDIARYQGREPVKARTPTVGYRVSRFVRRYRAGVATAAVIVLLVAAFGVTATAQSLRIRAQAADLAAERDRAQSEAAAAAEVADFMVSVFQVSDPLTAEQADSVTARSLLDRGADRIMTELSTAPDLRARMQDVIANAYRNLGLFRRAEPLAVASLEARREAFGETGPQTAESLRLLGRIRTDIEDFDGADEAFQEALAVQKALGPGDPGVLGTLADLSRANLLRGDHQAASEAAKELAVGLAEAMSGPSTPPRDVLWELVPVLGYSGDWLAASRGFGLLAELEEQRGGPVSIPVATALQQMAISEQRAGNGDRADSLFARALSIRTDLSLRDVATAEFLYEYGVFFTTRGDYPSADSLIGRALEIYRANVAPPHGWIGQAEFALGRNAIDTGRYLDAVPHLVEARANFEGGVGPGTQALLPVAVWRGGEALWKAGRSAEGEAWLREAISMFEADYSEDYILAANARRNLGELLIQEGRGAEAYPVLEDALRVLAKRWGDENWRSDGARVEIAHAMILMNRREEAAEILDVVVPRLEVEPGPDHIYSVRAREAVRELRR